MQRDGKYIVEIYTALCDDPFADLFSEQFADRSHFLVFHGVHKRLNGFAFPEPESRERIIDISREFFLLSPGMRDIKRFKLLPAIRTNKTLISLHNTAAAGAGIREDK